MTLQRNPGPVKRFGKLTRFAAWLQDIPNKVTPAPFRLMQIGSAFWQSRALYVAARLNIATLLADRNLSTEEIAEHIHTQPDATYRLLRFLVAMGVFAEVTPRVFGNNKLSHYLRDDHLQSVRSMILMHNSPEMSRPWFEQLENSVRDGDAAFGLTHGQELFPYMDENAEFDHLFSKAMDSVEALSGDSFATDFDWARFDRIIDIGGSKGSKSIAILKRHKHLHSLVVDRAQIIQGAASYWEGREDPTLLKRMSFQAGDVFKSIPTARSNKDIYLLSAVLHGFDDESCIIALRNLARVSTGAKATIALMEIVMPETGSDVASASFDMQMFIGTRGRERTLAEWQRLFEKSGLMLKEVVGLRSFGKLLIVRG